MPFERISEAIDVFGEQVHAALFGQVDSKTALDNAASGIERLP